MHYVHMNDILSILKLKKEEIHPACLASIIKVESKSILFTQVQKKFLPVIRWEGHIFYKFLQEKEKEKAVCLGLASPKPGGIKNTSCQEKRYALLAQAEEINCNAAYSSISIGIGQIMGFHASSLDYKSPKHMFEKACQGLVYQVEMVLRFLKKNNLIEVLKEKDWHEFARVYNGMAYKKNKYHIKIEKAYQETLKELVDMAESPCTLDNKDALQNFPTLSLGFCGNHVRVVQDLLILAGYELKSDGIFGIKTQEAVFRFQKKNNLKVTGVVDFSTLFVLKNSRSFPVPDTIKGFFDYFMPEYAKG